MNPCASCAKRTYMKFPNALYVGTFARKIKEDESEATKTTKMTRTPKTEQEDEEDETTRTYVYLLPCA